MIPYLAPALAVFIFCQAPSPVRAGDEDSPLWEMGIFAAAARLPHYRGSDEYRWYGFPLPYIVYRGDILRADREGVRGIFYRSERLETSISLYGNPPVSGDNDAREGMADLDGLFEAGPAVKWFFMGRDSRDPLFLQCVLRAAGSVGFDDGLDLAYQGLHGAVQAIYRNRTLFEDIGLRFGVTAGIDIADRRLNAYFYDVPPEDARPGRNAYASDGGYAGCSVAFTLQKTLTRNLSLGIYTRWENVSGAVFEDSPLVRDKNNGVVGAALIWKLFESEKRAATADPDE